MFRSYYTLQGEERMKQDVAIRQVGLAVKDDPAVRAVFLKAHMPEEAGCLLGC